jgi:hypothetical protein
MALADAGYTGTEIAAKLDLPYHRVAGVLKRGGRQMPDQRPSVQAARIRALNSAQGEVTRSSLSTMKAVFVPRLLPSSAYRRSMLRNSSLASAAPSARRNELRDRVPPGMHKAPHCGQRSSRSMILAVPVRRSQRN